MPDKRTADEQVVEHLGTRVRMLRLRTRLTIKDLAERAHASASMISKIEAGAANPSLDLLRRLAEELGTTIDHLMGADSRTAAPSVPARHSASVVRAGKRKRVLWPDSSIVYQMLTPDAQGEAEISWVDAAPGEGSNALHSERGQESIVVISGVLTAFVDGEKIVLEAGDCLTFDASSPHRYVNESDQNVVWIYVGAPPTL